MSPIRIRRESLVGTVLAEDGDSYAGVFLAVQLSPCRIRGQSLKDGSKTKDDETEGVVFPGIPISYQSYGSGRFVMAAMVVRNSICSPTPPMEEAVARVS